MRVFMALVGLVVSIPMGSATLEAELQQKWVVLKQWSGEPGVIETERITTSGSFRISWKAEALGRGGVLDIYVRDRDGKLVKAAVSLQASDPTKDKGTGSGTLHVRTEPGEHYLEIHSTGKKWQVAVEESKEP